MKTLELFFWIQINGRERSYLPSAPYTLHLQNLHPQRHFQEVPEISITLTPRCCSFSCLFFDLCGPALECAGEHSWVVWQCHCYFLTRVCGVTTMCCVCIMGEAKRNAPPLPGSFLCPFQVSMQLLPLPESLSSSQLPRWVPVALNLLWARESPESSLLLSLLLLLCCEDT